MSTETARSEADFHDARIAAEQDKNRLGFAYRSVADVYSFCDPGPADLGGRLLEVGCFRGDHGAPLRDMEGSYVGIDISPAAIEYCKGRGFPASFRFAVDDAHVLDSVEDGSVDYAFGYGVLHHLDLHRFGAAIARKLRRGGVARFVEPAQGNVLLRSFRKLTPHLRTADERPFDTDSIATLERHLSVSVRHHAFVRPFLPMLFANHDLATRASRWLDDRLLQVRPLRGQAWLLQIELRQKTPMEKFTAPKSS